MKTVLRIILAVFLLSITVSPINIQAEDLDTPINDPIKEEKTLKQIDRTIYLGEYKAKIEGYIERMNSTTISDYDLRVYSADSRLYLDRVSKSISGNSIKLTIPYRWYSYDGVTSGQGLKVVYVS